MFKCIITLHTNVSQMIFSKKIKSCLEVIIPLNPQRNEAIANCTALLEENLSSVNKSEVKLIIVESNYGKPGDEEVNENLLGYYTQNFPNAQIVAYSGTHESLADTLRKFPNIFVYHKSFSAQELIEKLHSVFNTISYISYTHRVLDKNSFTSVLDNFSPSLTAQIPPSRATYRRSSAFSLGSPRAVTPLYDETREQDSSLSSSSSCERSDVSNDQSSELPSLRSQSMF